MSYLFAGETVKDSPLVERFTPEPLISYYVSWFLIGQCGVTVALLLLPSPCPAKNNDVTLVAMVHSGASRNMPEKERERERLLRLEAMLKQWSTHFITLQSFFSVLFRVI